MNYIRPPTKYVTYDRNLILDLKQMLRDKKALAPVAYLTVDNEDRYADVFDSGMRGYLTRRMFTDVVRTYSTLGDDILRPVL